MAFLRTEKSRSNLAIDQLCGNDNVANDTVFMPPQLDGSSPIAVIRLKGLMAQTGLSRSAVYDRIAPASKRYDPSFPAQIRLGVNGRAVGWLSAEVDVWLQAQIAVSRSACK